MQPKNPRKVTRVGIPRSVALLFVTLTFVVGWITIVSLDVTTMMTTTTVASNSTFPSQQQFQQSFSSSGVTMYEHFVYANSTYQYRYSTKLFAKSFPTMKDAGAETILPVVVYGVCANAGKPVRRNAIRKSWGLHVPVYFLVAGNWESVEEEFKRFGDLLWVDIPEDYRNALTPKTMAFVHFSSNKAIPAMAQALKTPVEYMFKTDDDVYINATEMSRELHVHGHPDYYGLLRKDTKPIRNKTETGLVSKWYMSKEEYPRDLFPPYAHGTGYALSKRFGKCAAKAMATMIPMPWEDVATGMLAETCGVTLTPSDPEWSHFVPFDSPESEWIEFPYHRFKNGSVLVKILHKVKPWFFEPLSRQASLVEAREYGGKKRLELRQRREAAAEGRKQLPAG